MTLNWKNIITHGNEPAADNKVNRGSGDHADSGARSGTNSGTDSGTVGGIKSSNDNNDNNDNNDYNHSHSHSHNHNHTHTHTHNLPHNRKDHNYNYKYDRNHTYNTNSSSSSSTSVNNNKVFSLFKLGKKNSNSKLTLESEEDPLCDDQPHSNSDNNNIPLPTSLNPSTPIKIKKAKKSRSSSHSNSINDIFERNVQSNTSLEDSEQYSNYSNSSNLNLNCSPANRRSNSFNINLTRPTHLLSENYTSPILDSNVELITNKNLNLDDVDLVQVPNLINPKAKLFRTVSTSSNHLNQQQRQQSAPSMYPTSPSSPRISLSKKYSNNYEPKISRSKSFLSGQQYQQLPALKKEVSFNCTCASSPTERPPLNSMSSSVSSSINSPNRKSISFYSYSDLVNYERMSNSLLNNNNNAISNKENEIEGSQDSNLQTLQSLSCDTSTISPNKLSCSSNSSLNCPLHGKKSSSQGCLEDCDAKIDQELELNPKADLYPFPKNGKSSNDVFDDDESIQSWNPMENSNSFDKNDDLIRTRSKSRSNSRSNSRSHSIVDDIASLRSVNTNNSYFEDELLQQSTNDSNLVQMGEPLVNVCSAKDFLRSKSRELKSRFVDN